MGKYKVFNRLFSFNSKGSDFDNSTFKFSFQVKLLIISISIFLCSFLFTFHFDTSLLKISQHTLQLGTPWQNQTLKADNTFPIFKSKDEYNKLVLEAETKAMPVFSYNQIVLLKTKKELQNIFDKLKLADENTRFFGNYDVNQRLLMMFLEFPEKTRNDEIAKMNRLIANYIEKIFENGLVNISIEKITTPEVIVEISPTERTIIKKRFLTSVDNLEEKLILFVKAQFLENTEPLLIDILKTEIVPNLIYNSELSQNEKEIAKKNVSMYDGYVRAGEVLVEKGQIITKEINQKIESYRESKKLISENYLTPSYVLGNIGYALIIFSMILVYLIIIRKRIFKDNTQMIVLFGSLIFVTFTSWLTVEIPSEYPIGYLIPVPAISMLIAIVFDSRTAFYTTITSALLLAAARGNDFNLAISFIFAGVLAAFTVRDIQNRTQMFRSIFIVIIGITFSIVVFDLQASVESSYTLTKIIFALINATLSPIITYGVLFIIERTTNFSTDLRLKEFDDISHPLLKKMNEIALGTYQHTINVAHLAERCAIEIGANPLLARVGAIFHDIGKIAKPEYFTENQKEIDNKLEHLPPRKSVEVIKKHIIDGIELAKEYKIPERIIDFIPMHHGTCLIKHFYAKALEESNMQSDINEIDFRYPGPKPNSKETAILMICDSSEAISKVQDLTQEEIRNMIKKNIHDKFLDGQFNDSPLSFRELSLIEETIFKNLTGVHQRTPYKEIPSSLKFDKKNE